MSKNDRKTPDANKNAPSKMKRRSFLAGIGLAAGALAVPSASAMSWMQESATDSPVQDHAAAQPSLFTNEPPRQRKSFHDLTDAELVVLLKAVSFMRNGSKDVPLEIDSPRQWDQWAMAHAKHCTEAGPAFPQVHWSWFFLPWHRAYLWFLERHLAYILTHDLGMKKEGETFALPYWDWITRKEIPNTRERELAGKASPLFGYNLALENMVRDDGLGFDNQALWDGYRGPTILKPKMDPANELTQDSKEHVAETIKFTSPGYIQSILELPFPDFAGKEIISRADGQGALESGPHNDVHDWVGSRLGKNRDMGTLRYAALDPIFCMHHANIDRIWSLYRKPQPNPDTSPWGKQAYTFINVDGSPVTVTVRDVVKYMTNVTYAPPRGALLAARMFAVPQVATEQNPVENSGVFTQSPNATLTAKPLTVTVQPDAETDALLKEGAGHTPATLSLLEIETGPIAYRDKFSIRLFVNKPDANLHTSLTDLHYIGRIEGMDSERRGSAEEAESSHTFPIVLGRSDSNFYKLAHSGKSFTVTFVAVGPTDADPSFSVPIKSIKLKVFEQ